MNEKSEESIGRNGEFSGFHSLLMMMMMTMMILFPLFRYLENTGEV